MSGLKMPGKGKAALLLSELNAEHAPPLEESDQASTVTTLQVTNVTTLQASNVDFEPVLGSAERAERLRRGLQIGAQDELSVVTIRVSSKLNEYMDRYVERRNRLQPRQRYRKQDAVAEAFAAFFADHPLPPPPPDEEFS